jgi:hypothetical protein
LDVGGGQLIFATKVSSDGKYVGGGSADGTSYVASVVEILGGATLEQAIVHEFVAG